jgi:hypothetical protein
MYTRTLENFKTSDIPWQELESRFWIGSPPLQSLYHPTPPVPHSRDPDPDASEDPVKRASTAMDVGNLGSVSDYIFPRACGTESFFYTDFDRGFGTRYFINGKVRYDFFIFEFYFFYLFF